MKNSKLLLILLPIAALLFWYLGKPPANPPDAPQAEHVTTAKPTQPAPPANPNTPNSPPPLPTPPAPDAAPAQRAPNAATAGATQQAPAPTGDIELPAASPVPVGGNPNLDPEQKLEALRHTFRTYGQRFKGNPVGNNAEITAALLGQNPGSANYLADGTHGLNDHKELCDHWGTPYFFHQLSGTEMEIRSAGPDKKMWTADDLVTK